MKSGAGLKGYVFSTDWNRRLKENQETFGSGHADGI